jgi:hypothetical protein
MIFFIGFSSRPSFAPTTEISRGLPIFGGRALHPREDEDPFQTELGLTQAMPMNFMAVPFRFVLSVGNLPDIRKLNRLSCYLTPNLPRLPPLLRRAATSQDLFAAASPNAQRAFGEQRIYCLTRTSIITVQRAGVTKVKQNHCLQKTGRRIYTSKGCLSVAETRWRPSDV